MYVIASQLFQHDVIMSCMALYNRTRVQYCAALADREDISNGFFFLRGTNLYLSNKFLTFKALLVKLMTHCFPSAWCTDL